MINYYVSGEALAQMAGGSERCISVVSTIDQLPMTPETAYTVRLLGSAVSDRYPAL